MGRQDKAMILKSEDLPVMVLPKDHVDLVGRLAKLLWEVSFYLCGIVSVRENAAQIKDGDERLLCRLVML